MCKDNRAAFLQRFLNSLLERRELRNSNFLQDFAKNQDLKKIYGSLEVIKKKNIFTTLERTFSDDFNELILNAYKKMSEK